MTTYQFGNTPVYVSEGQTVRFRFKAPSAWDTTLSVVVRIGDQTTIWYISTIPRDFAPDPFPFSTLDNADPDTLYTYGDGSRAGEQIVTVAGLTETTDVGLEVTSSHIEQPPDINKIAVRLWRVSQGETTWGAWGTPDGWVVQNTDKVQVRLASNTQGGQSKYANLTIGTRTEKWTINTKVPPPNFPDPFPLFDPIYDAELDTDVYSNIVQIQGMSDFGLVTTDNGALIGISDTNTTYTNSDGYEVLDGITFVDSNTSPNILNGKFLQLMITTSATANTTINNIVTIGNGGPGTTWQVTTGDLPSVTPDVFSFTDKDDQMEETLIMSDEQPAAGLLGLGAGVTVDVELVTTTGTEPGVRIQHNGAWSSWGIFPASVENGDKIQIRNKSSATFLGVITTTIKVGSRQIAPWSIITNSGPDTDADFTAPANLTNTAPNTPVVSSIVSVTGINRPITISATNGAKISIDFGTFVTGPVTFDPAQHSVFQLQITTDGSLSGNSSTQVTVGTGTTGNPFTWSATNYAVAPPPPELKGCWYSKKTAFVDMSGGGSGVIRENKEDGYAIGTVLPVLKSPSDASNQDPMQQYGELKGNTAKGRLDARYPGYIDCDGSEYNVADFPDLWLVIGNVYAKPTDDPTQFGEWDNQNKQFSGKFRVPDYRNRKIVGPGQVDGNRGSSTILPIDVGIHPNKTFNARESGGIGGYWYVDDVDTTAGDPNPYQQIEGDVGGSTGITSDFFNFGTVRTTSGTTQLQADVEFEVTGDVTATVGPLSDVMVNIPAHSHYYISAISAATVGGDPLISWGNPALFGFEPYNFGSGFDNSTAWLADRLGRLAWTHGENLTTYGYGSSLWWNNPNNTEDWHKDRPRFAGEWINILTAALPKFQLEWDKLVSDTADSLITEMTDLANNIDEHGNLYEDALLHAKTWWASPGDLVADEYFKPIATSKNPDNSTTTAVYSTTASLAAGTSGVSTVGSHTQTYPFSIWNAKVLGVIDTRDATFRLEPYEPPIIFEDTDSSIATHAHYLSDYPLTDPTTDFGYGNVSGPGHKQGLGTAASATRPVTFLQTDVRVELNVGTFNLNKGTKLPDPNVVFHPNRKVELVPKFHKVKYIIKAF